MNQDGEDASSVATTASQAGWRVAVGGVVFGLSIALPLAGVPLVAASGWSATTITAVTGALLGTAEVLGIASIAIMGKPGFELLKRRVFKLLRRAAGPSRVGRTRYRLGLVMFVAPMLVGWLEPYVSSFHPIVDDRLPLALVADVVWLSSLLVLGGEFWDKLRALFVHEARVSFPGSSAPSA